MGRSNSSPFDPPCEKENSLTSTRGYSTKAGMNAGKFLVLSLSVTAFLVVASTLLIARNRSARAQALQHLHEVGRNPRLCASPSEILRAFGKDEGTAILAEMAATYPEFCFDGRRRFCQIHREGYRGESDYCDTICLTPADANRSAEWLGPHGLRVKHVEFQAASLTVLVYGSFSVEAEGFDVSEETPMRLSIPWRPGEEPEPGRLEDLIAESALPAHQTEGSEP